MRSRALSTLVLRLVATARRHAQRDLYAGWHFCLRFLRDDERLLPTESAPNDPSLTCDTVPCMLRVVNR